MRRICLIIILLVGPLWAQNATEALVQSLVASPREGWGALLAAHQGSLEMAALKPVAQQALTLPLDQARKTMEAVDAVAAKASGNYEAPGQKLLIQSLIKGDKFKEALEVATALAAAHPELGSAQALRGLCLMETASYEEARQVFEALTKSAPMYEVAWTELGRANVFLNRRDDALAAFKQALAINPENGFARDAVATLSGTGAPIRLKANSEARAHFEKAEAFFAERKFTEAIAEYRLSAQADPKFAKPLVYIGDCYFQLGDPDQAIESYKQALVIDPKDKQAHRFLGDMYERKFDKTGEVTWLDQAIASYKAALQSDPQYGAAQSALQRAEAKNPRRNNP